MHNILLIEDSKEIHQLVTISLTNPLIKLDWVTNINDATAAIEKKDYELILLDLELPDGNGITFCSNILQNNPQASIFILTASDEISQKVLGFTAGADDYITKPFEPLELKARVEAKLKKIQINSQIHDQLNWDQVQINISTQTVEIFVDENWQNIDLTALEFKILVYLAQRVDEVVERDTVLNEVWGRDVHVYSRSVDTHVSKLRKKLAPHSDIIESVHGVGYKFKPSSN